MEFFRQKRLTELILNLSTGMQVKRVLEIGPGLNPTCHALNPNWEVTYFEPLDFFFQDLEKRLMPNSLIKIYQYSIEDTNKVDFQYKFDLIVMSSVLHELTDSERALSNVTKLLAAEGFLVIIVPNRDSLHRVEFSSSNATQVLSDTEIKMQQLRNFSPNSLSSFLEKNGFVTTTMFTSFVKPFHHARMQEMIEEGILNFSSLNKLYEISSSFDPHCSEIFWVGRLS